MNNQAHPIEFFLACLINLFEFICYIINEAAGFHTTTKTTTAQPTIQTTTTTQPTATLITSTKPNQQPLFDTFQALTVKQLRLLTGIKNSRVHKQQLIAIAIA